MRSVRKSTANAADSKRDVPPSTARLHAGTAHSAIFNGANSSSIATDAENVIQIFNFGAERMLGYAAAEVMNTVTPGDGRTQ